MGISTQYALANETGAKAQNAEWLAADITVGDIEAGRSSTLELTMIFSVTAPVVEYTLDSGATWYPLKLVALIVGETLIERIPGVLAGDLINFRTPTVGGTTLDLFRVSHLPVI